MSGNDATAPGAAEASTIPKVIVTRENPGPVCEAVRTAGGEAIALPLLATRWMPFEIPSGRGLDDYDWVVFTSARTLEALAKRAVHDSWNWPPRSKAAAVGDRTAHELQARGWMPDCVSSGSGARSLVEALRPRVQPGTRLLFPCSALADSTLPDGMRAVGAAVDVVHVYRTETVWEHDAGRRSEIASQLQAALRDGGIPTCASPSAVNALVEIADAADMSTELKQTTVVVLGPTTAKAAQKHGLRTVESDGKTLDGMARTAVEAGRARQGS